MKKHAIQVLTKSGELIKIIKRKLRAECIGNFNPIFCTYQGKQYLVKSKKGDLSDPFRRNDSYVNSLFITIEL